MDRQLVFCFFDPPLNAIPFYELFHFDVKPVYCFAEFCSAACIILCAPLRNAYVSVYRKAVYIGPLEDYPMPLQRTNRTRTIFIARKLQRLAALRRLQARRRWRWFPVLPLLICMLLLGLPRLLARCSWLSPSHFFLSPSCCWLTATDSVDTWLPLTAS